ncbi:MAG: MATE family efflux transporter, partial [Myxococcota bacterium]
PFRRRESSSRAGMGWGAAASSYVGMNLGAGHARRAHRSGLVASGYALLTTALLVALYLGFSEPIIGFFDPSPGVLQAGDEYLHRIGWTYLFVGVAVVLSQAMTGAGATFASMVLDASILVLLVVPAAYVVVEVLHLPRTALWWTIAVGNVVAAAAYVAFYGKGSFLRTKIY